MINVNSFDHINLNVSNLSESLNFYQAVFGMNIKEEGLSGARPYAIIGSGNVNLALYENHEELSSGGLNHIGIHINDFENSFELLKKNGVEMDYDDIIEYDNSRSIYVRDPDGYGLELSEQFAGNL